MTHERICGPQRQPCPTPWACGVDCNFQSAEVETPHDKAARHFWSNKPPIVMLPTWRDWLSDMLYSLPAACAWIVVIGFAGLCAGYFAVKAGVL